MKFYTCCGSSTRRCLQYQKENKSMLLFWGTNKTTATVLLHRARSDPDQMRDLFPGDSEELALDELVRLNVADDAGGGVVCLLCGARLRDASKSNVRRHMKDMHLYYNLRYRCPVCHRVYKSQNSIRTHMSMYHKAMKMKLDLKKCLVR